MHSAVCTQGPHTLLGSHSWSLEARLFSKAQRKRTNGGLLVPQRWLTLNYHFSLSTKQHLEGYNETSKFQ